ncbi:Protein nrde2 [Geranomyces variabilis]|nr:Protein nrde2 [Geranomyces variabilis]
MVIQTADFYTDRRGDKQNLLFAKSDTYAMPSYRRWGDFIIGASTNWRIDHGASRKNRDLVVTTRTARDSSTTGLGIGKARYQDFKRLLQAPATITLERLQNETSSSDTADFIGFALPSAPTAGLHAEPVILNENADYTRKTASLNNKLRENPKDLQSWLDLVALQDELVVAARQDGKKSGGGIRAAVYEKQQAIYERALRELPQDESLRCGYMRVCQETWDTTALLTKWDHVLKLHGHSPILWKQYLDFRQTSYSAFTVSSCLDTYESCIRAINLGPRSNMSAQQREDLLLHVFARACTMLAQAGFIERAVGCWQAMIEFSCFVPWAFEGQTFAQRMGMFEEWWEGEAPRFGEAGARGWAGSIMGGGAANNAEGLADSAAGLIPPMPPRATTEEGGGDAMAAFAAREAYSEFYAWIPRRGAVLDDDSDKGDDAADDDDDDDDDPYRTIVFDDVSTLMFAITLRESRARLIHSFFHFLSAPFDGGYDSTNAPFWQDALLHSEFAHSAGAARFWPPPDAQKQQHSLLALPDAAVAHPTTAKLESNPFSIPLKTYPQSATTTLAGQPHTWYQKFTRADAESLQARGYDRAEFVRSAMRLLLASSGGGGSGSRAASMVDSAPLLVAFEAGFSVKKAQKVGKALLKDDRDNLVVWNAYAQLEVARGKHDEARKVYKAALTSCRSMSPAQRASNAPLLYRMLAYLEFEQGRGGAALHVLAAFALDEALPSDHNDADDDPQMQQQPPSPTTLLRARNAFTQLINNALAQRDVVTDRDRDSEEPFTHLVACAALTEYLAHGLDDARRLFDRVLDALQTTTTTTSTTLKNVTPLEELLWMEQARLVRAHAVSGAAFVPATLRGVLERALERVPSNVALWGLYGWNEARTKIEMRVRARVEGVLAK